MSIVEGVNDMAIISSFFIWISVKITVLEFFSVYKEALTKSNCFHENHLKHSKYIYVSLRLRMQNAVPAQPCVGKLGISLVLLNFLHCNFRLWFKTPYAFNSYPCHASVMNRNTLNHCLKFALHSVFCHICYGKISEKMSTLSLKLNYWSPRHQTAVFKVLISFKCS